MNQTRNPHFKKNGGGGREQGQRSGGPFRQKSFQKFGRGTRAPGGRPNLPIEPRVHGEVAPAPKKTIADFERQFNAMNTKIDTMLRLIQEMAHPEPTDDEKPRY